MNWSEWQFFVIIKVALFAHFLGCTILSHNAYINLSEEIITFRVMILFVLMFQTAVNSNAMTEIFS